MVNLSLVHSLYFLWDFLCLISKIPCLGENEDLNGGVVGVKTPKVILTNFLAILDKLEQLWFVHFWRKNISHIFWGGGVRKMLQFSFEQLYCHFGQFGRNLIFFIFQQFYTKPNFFSPPFFFGGGGGQKCNFIFLLVGSIVVGMPNFSSLEGLEVGFLCWKKNKQKKQNNSLVLRATLASAKSLAELG